MPRLDVELEMANNRPQANAAVPLLKLNAGSPSPMNGGTIAGSGHSGSGEPLLMKLYVPVEGEDGGVDKPAGGGGNYSPPRGGTFEVGAGLAKKPMSGDGRRGDYSPPMIKKDEVTVDVPIHPAYAR